MSDERLADKLQRFAAMPYWNEYESMYVAERLLPKAAAQLAEAERREKEWKEEERRLWDGLLEVAGDDPERKTLAGIAPSLYKRAAP
jgi:hypothetical protein